MLLGYYGRGNYGDDLMAWMIARHLGTEGISCSVFSLGDGPRDSLLVPDFVRSGIESTQDPEAALSRPAFVVKGGGDVRAWIRENQTILGPGPAACRFRGQGVPASRPPGRDFRGW